MHVTVVNTFSKLSSYNFHFQLPTVLCRSHKKTFATYLFFASSLICLRRELANMKCFGTDGEAALIDAFQLKGINNVQGVYI